MKYIDADLLRKEIESRMGDCDANSKNPNQLLWAELAALIPLIDSLQQEQPSEKTCKNCGFYENNCPYIRGKFIPYPSKVCKDYTYSVIKEQEQPCDTCTNDKGCVTCKDGELWEGKEQQEVDLEKEIKRYLQEEHDRDTTVRDVARHFANWQKEQILQLAKNRYEVVMAFGTGNPDVDHALQMDRLALVKIIEEDKK